jgi:acetyl esterase
MNGPAITLLASRFRLGAASATLLLPLVSADASHAAPRTEQADAARKYPPQLRGAVEHVYKRIGDVEIKLYEFAPQGDAPAGGRPAIVFFFGGGWASGSPQQFEQQCRYLASRGMTALAADYRVANRHGVKGVDCVRDAKSAIRWVRQHAEELHIDPKRIVAGGGSAGGHIAACTGTIDDYDEPDEDGSISSRPDAMVLFNPALSFDANDVSPEKRKVLNFGKRMGVEPTLISPAHHVSDRTPPTIVLLGTEDYLRDGVETFAAAMEKAGRRVKVDWYEGRKHGFFNYRGKPSQDFLAALASADKFLQSLGYLNGPETTRTFFDSRVE